MRAVLRGKKAPPSALSKRGRDRLTELERVRNHMQAPVPAGETRSAFGFRNYKSAEVKRRLEDLFHGKCAYCETYYAAQAPVDVEHYRPKGAVEDDPDHSGYWWLAMDWQNLLPSCIDCNRRRKQKTPELTSDLSVLHKTMLTGKKDCFPVSGIRVADEAGDVDMEGPLLLDPTREDPAEHLHYWLGDGPASGLILPRATDDAMPVLPVIEDSVGGVVTHAVDAGLSIRGAVSIQVYGLNRLHLLQQRAQLLQRLRFLEYIVIHIGEAIQTLSLPHLRVHEEVVEATRNLLQLQDRVIAEMTGLASPKEPYSVMAAAYIKDFKNRLLEG